MNGVFSLRTRLLLTYTGLLLVGLTGLALLAGRQISAGVVEDFEHNLTEDATIMAQGLAEIIEHVQEGEMQVSRLEGLMAEYARRFPAQIRLLHADGAPWLSAGETELSIPPPTPESPEITAALGRQVTYDTRRNRAGETIVYTAAPIIEDGRILALVHLASPLTGAQPLITQRWLALAAGALLMALIVAAVSIWLATTLTTPLEQLRAAALRLAGGDLEQRIAIRRQDEIGEVAAAFNHMADRVRAMIEEQRAFASNASHELRTPLTTIRLRSEALRREEVDDTTARQYIVEIDNEVNRLSDLVRDLILLSRLDAGRLQEGEEQVDPARLARQIQDHFRPQAEANEQSLILEVADTLPPITAGLTHLHVVFRNLISNALKYTPPGGTIRWRLWVEGDYLHGRIVDDGIGIPAEDLPRIYDRFYRADKARSRARPGVGLGLALVRAIVEFYDGEIQIKSEGAGRGTAVAIKWPLS